MKSAGRSLLIIACLVFAVGATCPGTAMGRTRLGVSGSLGGGLFFPSDQSIYTDVVTNALYGDLIADPYPEVGLQLRASTIRTGLRVGFLHHMYASPDPGCDPGGIVMACGETLTLLPVQLEYLVAPMKYGVFSPYAGALVGALIPIGSHHPPIAAVSPKIGIEGRLDPLLIHGDIRYTWARRDGVDYGGFLMVMGVGFYFGP
jgi:hypothetical protein